MAGPWGSTNPATCCGTPRSSPPTWEPTMNEAGVLLEVDGVSAAYGKVVALRGVSISVRSGEIVAILGSNGAGKTTLLNAISGVLPITDGRINFAGIRI